MNSIKLENLKQFVKTTPLKVIGDRFYRLEDKEGWSNGYIADFSNTNADEMGAYALIKSKSITIIDSKPRIGRLIEHDFSHEVEDIALDLADGYVKLQNSTIKTAINPIYLTYFVEKYGTDIDIALSGELTPVAIKKDGELLGLIMPIRLA